MRKTLLFASLLFLQITFSQTITQSFNEPMVGDTDRYYGIDTSGLKTGMPNSVSGNGVTWDFSKINVSEPKYYTSYVSPSTVTNSSNYAGCAFVERQGPTNNFYKSTLTPTTQTELLGITSSTLSLTFTNSAIVAKYPMAYNTSYTDNMSGTFVFTVNGTFNGNLNTIADGTGTLLLPNGASLNNVLRVKSVQTLSMSAVVSTLIPIPLNIATIKQTTYYYFHSSNKFPVLDVSYQSITMLGSTTPTVSGGVTGNSKFLVSGLKEQNFSDEDFNIFPNPIEEKLYFQIPNSQTLESIKIYQSNGLLVEENANNLELDFSSYEKGIYFVEIQTNKNTIRKKIIKN